MQKDKWLEAWQTNRIGFHQSAFNKDMKEHYDLKNLTGKTVLIPLAGKSLDIHYFLERSANVIACELSSIAIEAFFAESKMEYKKEIKGEFEIYRAQNLDFYLGDFFELSKTMVNHVDFLYDRACVVALPKDLRSKYFKKIQHLINAKTDILILTFTHDGPIEFGAPFYVPEQELIEAYKEMGHQLHMTSKNPEKADGRFKEAGINTMTSLKWRNNI